MLEQDALALKTGALSGSHSLGAPCVYPGSGLSSGLKGGLGLDNRSLSPAALPIVSVDENWSGQLHEPTINSTPFEDNFSFFRANSTFQAALEQSVRPAAAASSFNLRTDSSLTSTSIDALTGRPSHEHLSAFSTQDELLSPQTSRRPRYIQGNLLANRFTANLTEALTIISGNGNVEYGEGKYDYLDLSHVSTRSVTQWSPAESSGVLFNTGRGDRVFDSLRFSNGSQVIFEGLDAVRFAEGMVDLSVDPNDPAFSAQWNLHMMGVQNAWRFTKGNDNVVIGVQDTGIGLNRNGQTHAELTQTWHFGNNWADDFSNSFASHGTGVQSIISARSNNGSGMSGINWNSDVFNIDVLGNTRNTDFSLAAATQAMINHANAKGQRLVVNMSLGGHGFFDNDFATLVANNQHNALFVVASGNENVSQLAHPANLASRFGNVISVGASWGKRDRHGNAVTVGDRIRYHDWGSNYGQGLSLMGPSEVIAAKAINTRSGVQFDMYDKFDGTSAATPNVAGVASLVWSVNPNLSATQVHQIMAETAYDLGNRGYDLVTGHGFINADAAVRRAMALSRASASRFNPFGSELAAAGTQAIGNMAQAMLAKFDTASSDAANLQPKTPQAAAALISAKSIRARSKDTTTAHDKPLAVLQSLKVTDNHTTSVVKDQTKTKSVQDGSDALLRMPGDAGAIAADWLTQQLTVLDEPIQQLSPDSLLNPGNRFAA